MEGRRLEEDGLKLWKEELLRLEIEERKATVRELYKY
jgi:hypothetical protein